MSQDAIMSKLWRAWEAYWFPQTTAARLAAMRIIFVALQLFWFFEPLGVHVKYLEAAGFIQPQAAVKILLLFVPEAMVRTHAVIVTLWWVTVVAGVLALIGLFTRTSMFLFAVGCLWLINFEYSYGMVHHPDAIFLIALLCIGMSPCGKCLSIDVWWHRRRGAPANEWGLAATATTATWALRLVQWLLVIAYFEAFLSKATVGGLQWMNGYTLQSYMLRDGIRWDRPLGVWLAQFRWLCIVLAAGTMLIEATFFVVMFGRSRRLRRIIPLYFLGGVTLHVSIFLIQAAPFWQFLALYLTWLPWEKWLRPASQTVPVPAAATATA